MASSPSSPPPRPPGTDPYKADSAPPAHDTPGPDQAAYGGVDFKPGAWPVPDYQLVQRLGRGGFGEVWKALGPGGVAVALKFIRLEDKAGAVEQRSLDLIRDIRHPNLLALFGSWQRDGFLILALELGAGTLLDRLKAAQAAGSRGIPLGELLDHMRDAARGLDYLNGQGIQHRDVKPHNFLLVGDGVKVADFGLAKLLQHTLTSNSGSMTPAYAAPEFFNGQISSLSDQYSLAVTYCQLRGGRLPFGGSVTELMMGHVTREPDLTMLPEREWRVVRRALAKKPPERWPSCKAFVEALASASQATTTISLRPPVPRAATRPLAALALALAGVAAALLLGWSMVIVLLNRGDRDRFPEIVNSLGMPLVLIPAGTFQMGSPADEKDRSDDEGPQHEVQITRAFYLGKQEVTRGQFRKFVEATGYQTEAEKDGEGGWGFNKETKQFEERKPQYNWKNAGFDQTDEHPVVNVTWNDAQAFCAWLSQKESKKYRLPTEAEWEYHCRAHTTTRFHSGDDEETLAGVANVADATAKEQFPTWTTINGRDGHVFTAPVGRFKPNGFGLLDMHGNVWEWCQDWYKADYYKDSPRQDPPGADAGSFRVIRGGSFGSAARDCRAACRYGRDPADRLCDFGFRVVLLR